MKPSLWVLQNAIDVSSPSSRTPSGARIRKPSSDGRRVGASDRPGRECLIERDDSPRTDLLRYPPDVHEDLLECMNRVFVRGCEAHYLESILRASESCPGRSLRRGGGGGGGGSGSSEGMEGEGGEERRQSSGDHDSVGEGERVGPSCQPEGPIGDRLPLARG